MYENLQIHIGSDPSNIPSKMYSVKIKTPEFMNI
jgi:hypothetical protein